MMLMMSPRYPEVQIRLRTRNPFALISAVRQGLRRSRVDDGEIRRFTEEAMRSEEPNQMREVCAAWAAIDPTAS